MCNAVNLRKITSAFNFDIAYNAAIHAHALACDKSYIYLYINLIYGTCMLS